MSERPSDMSPAEGGVSRRRFFAVAATSLLPLIALATRPWSLITATPARGRDDADVAASRLAGLLPHPESARAVGRAWLAASSSTVSLATLHTAVADGLGTSHRAIATADEAVLAAAIIARIERDFAAESVTVVDGWVLSVTETRICAIAALVG